MFLQKYKNKKRLGKGAFEDVYLVENTQGQQFALKLISVKLLQAQPHVRPYLDGEIQCMRNMKSPHIIKLYDVMEDKDFIYMLLEYCSGGDLLNYQSLMNDKVFPLETATEVLAQVINGLEDLHKTGYLHRDIKPQNVLVTTQNGKTVCKLADFGFAKKKVDVHNTVLGTQQYMSPEIYEEKDDQTYGFEVDMWAFGVLFYFMLNLEPPFRINTYLPQKKKCSQLKKLAENFDFETWVARTKKKKMENCTPEMKDLFKRIFNLDVSKRITFTEIRQHPVFAKHFSIISQDSLLLYKKKYVPSKLYPTEKKMHTPTLETINEEVMVRQSIIREKHKSFPKQKEILEKKIDQISFLGDNVEEIMDCGNILKYHEKLMISYNILKYYIILLREFKTNLNLQSLNIHYPNLKWVQYIKTDEFKKIFKEVESELSSSQLKFTQYYDQCEDFLLEISQINKYFKIPFLRNVEELSFQDQNFKSSYRASTILVSKQLNATLKNKKSNRTSYILTLVYISHAFNNIIKDIESKLESDQQIIADIFSQYLLNRNKTVKDIDFTDLRSWMSSSSENDLYSIRKPIYLSYFSSGNATKK